MKVPFTDFGKPHHFEFTTYLLQGTEAEILHEVLERLIGTLLPEGRDFNLTWIEGQGAKGNAIFGMAQTAPFLANRRAVIVRAVEKMTKEEQQTLATSLTEKNLPPTALLILQRSTMATQGSRGESPAVARAVEKQGLVIQCDLTGRAKEIDQQLSAMAQKEATRLGKRLMPSAANRLVQRVEPHWGIVANEVRKLALFIGDRPTIGDADVNALTPETREEVVFKLVDAIAAGSVGQSLAFAAHLHAQGEAVEMILWNLSRHFRFLLQARWLMDEGKLSERGLLDVEDDEMRLQLPDDHNIVDSIRQQSWRAQQFVRQARMLSLGQIKRAFERILHTDLQLKGAEEGGQDRRLALEMMCVDLCRSGSQQWQSAVSSEQ